MTKKNKRTARTPLSRAEFARELTKVLDGDPSADESVRAFWNDTSRALGVRAALQHPNGVEVLRETKRRKTR